MNFCATGSQKRGDVGILDHVSPMSFSSDFQRSLTFLRRGSIQRVRPMSLSAYTTPSPVLQKEVTRRRSFAIISHPDAGKTTMTEKFLLYGGALQLAGSVTAKKNQRATTSDWMEMEKQRGISVSSTVLQFEYKDCVVNILDTPGHKDFSEDTYRVLTAVDAAVTSTLASLHPRSNTTSVLVTPAMDSIVSTIFWGVALIGPR